MRRAAEERAAKSGGGTTELVADLADFPSESAAPAEPAARSVDARHDASAPPDVEVMHLPAAIEPPPDTKLPAPATRARTSLLQHMDERLATKTVVDDTMPPASREQYRRLAAALHQSQRMNNTKVVMIASAAASEGKTLTASNLALTLSESYRRNVLLVDGDLRRPSLHSVFQIPGTPGLSEGLVSIEETTLPLHRLSDRLAVLPAGRPTSDPIGALTAERMHRLIQEAREVFDWVIIDTPPVGLLTDAALLSSMADGVVLVVKAGSTPYDLVNRAVDAIGRERLMGVVLNRATELPHRSNYDYYNYYYSGSTNAVAKK